MVEAKLINKIQRVMGYGMTCPLHIVADDGKDYILKTRIKTFGTNDEPPTSSKELFAEIFSYFYLQALKAPCIPNFCLLKVNDETLKLAQKYENSPNESQKILALCRHSGLSSPRHSAAVKADKGALSSHPALR